MSNHKYQAVLDYELQTYYNDKPVKDWSISRPKICLTLREMRLYLIFITVSPFLISDTLA